MSTGVLLMAYGSPDSPDDVEAYLRDIRGGKPIRPGLLEDLTERYRRIGGRSPLRSITTAQAGALGAALGPEHHVAVGMKHWTPTIRDAVGRLRDHGVDRVVGLALAPHYSSISIGGYESRAAQAVAELLPGVPFSMVRSWHDQPSFIELVASNLRDAMRDAPERTCVFFTAHSLPERIIDEGDPYRDQLLHSSKLVADAAGAGEHGFAFQSASATGEPWLGPDLLDALSAFAERGGRCAVVCPIGFVSDHLEILYDVDIEAAAHATSIGLDLRRVRSPNDDPRLIDALVSAVRGAA